MHVCMQVSIIVVIIMEVGPTRPLILCFWGLNSIAIVHMDP